jgi:cytochrome c biogenesis protein CcmG, thiol:disulfide interchange protein DsbE
MVSGALMAAVLLAFAVTPAGAQALNNGQALVNRPAPEFARKAMDGRTVDLKSYRGRIVLLDFWATWCAPCLVEMPRFARWQKQYGPQGLAVIGVSMDDDEATARKAVDKLKPGYAMVMGDAKLGTLYGGVMGLPLIYLIDADGVVRGRFEGETDPKAIEGAFERLLKRR